MAAMSMTGMGCASAAEAGVRVDADLRCVNRKQFDFDLSAPAEVAALDRRWREIVQRGISRGRVQCQIRMAFADGGEASYDVEALRRHGLEHIVHGSALERVNGKPIERGHKYDER